MADVIDMRNQTIPNQSVRDSPVVWLGILKRFSSVVNVTMKYMYDMAWMVPRRPYTYMKVLVVAYFCSQAGCQLARPHK